MRKHLSELMPRSRYSTGLVLVEIKILQSPSNDLIPASNSASKFAVNNKPLNGSRRSWGVDAAYGFT